MVWIEGPVIELMTCGIAMDERCFHLDQLPQDWKDLNLQLRGEQGRTNAIGPNATPLEIVKTFKVSPLEIKLTLWERLPKDGWDKVRPAMSFTIRSAFLLVIPETTRLTDRAFFVNSRGILGRHVQVCVALLQLSRPSIVNSLSPRHWTRRHGGPRLHQHSSEVLSSFSQMQ
jgi:hypothetical protein